MRLFGILILFLHISFLSAQNKVKEVKCGGTYSYSFSENVAPAEAKEKAVQNAIIRALADKFGTTVTSQSLMMLNGQQDTFEEFSRLHVKGQFVRHIHEPRISDLVWKDNLGTYEVTVSFYARPINYAQTEFEMHVLRNGKQKRFESVTFKSEDKFYLWFSSPRNGYLAVFFEDCDNALCMLPYEGEDDEPFRVRKGDKNVFFDTPGNTYHMICGEEPEINFVHIIFSPNPFIHGDLKRLMNRKEFNAWLDKQRSYDADMQVESVMIKVEPRDAE